jgi:hypothetical protein
MRGNLFPTTVYLDPEQRKQIQLLALTTKKPKAEITRQLIDEGLKTIKVQRTRSAKALLDLAGLIPAGSGLPKDLSEKHNEYAWDE